MSDLTDKAAAIRLLVLDVDGVLTDGRLHFLADGTEVKSFHVRDGAGIKALRKAGVEVAIISGRKSAAVDARMAELGVGNVIQNCDDKATAVRELMTKLGVEKKEVACVADNTPDLPMFEFAELAVSVADAHTDVIARATWTTDNVGGRGAVREVCDLILRARQQPGEIQ